MTCRIKEAEAEIEWLRDVIKEINHELYLMQSALVNAVLRERLKVLSEKAQRALQDKGEK